MTAGQQPLFIIHLGRDFSQDSVRSHDFKVVRNSLSVDLPEYRPQISTNHGARWNQVPNGVAESRLQCLLHVAGA